MANGDAKVVCVNPRAGWLVRLILRRRQSARDWRETMSGLATESKSIEVTPEMVKAGMSIMDECGFFEGEWAPGGFDFVLVKAYRAMEAVRLSAFSESHPNHPSTRQTNR